MAVKIEPLADTNNNVLIVDLTCGAACPDLLLKWAGMVTVSRDL